MEGILNWTSEEDMQKELQERIYSYKKGQSRDGFVLSAKGTFIHKGVAYLINVLRYFNHTDRFTTMSRRISDSHANVEYPDETKPIVDIIPQDYSNEFLYHDTLHSHNDNQTIEEQIKECHELAKDDIDRLLDGKIGEEINKGIVALKEIKDNLDKEIKKFVKSGSGEQ